MEKTMNPIIIKKDVFQVFGIERIKKAMVQVLCRNSGNNKKKRKRK
jgi:hypothetical protein